AVRAARRRSARSRHASRAPPRRSSADGICSMWNPDCRTLDRAGSMRLEVVERLETVFAAMLRLAGRRAETRQLAGPGRPAARARHRRLAATQAADAYRLHGGA